MRVLIKGAGDLATGVACRLFRCGYEIVMTDIAVPTAVRRTVSFSRAIYEGNAVVEGIEAVYASRKDPEGILEILRQEKIAVVADENAEIAGWFRPDVIVDAIIAKKNLGTKITDAPLVIGVGPGFTAQVDCHCVVETKRGHYLGKVMYENGAIPNTGIPGEIGGYTTERLIRAGADGIFVPLKQIGDRVEAGDEVAKVIIETTCVESKPVSGENGSLDLNATDLNTDGPNAAGPNKEDRNTAGSNTADRNTTGQNTADHNNEVLIYAQIPGIIRGMLQGGVKVHTGMKCGDIDPRCEQEHCYTVSDKARAIGGGVLEAISRFERRRNSIGIVLLAAGEGKRYGSNKLLDIVDGRRMFEYVLDAAADAAFCRAAIVTGYDEIAEYATSKGITAVRNDHPELGISESLKLGLRALTMCGIMFTVCDQPGLTSDSFRRLADGYAASDKGLACMGQGENLLGNPCVFSKKYFDELLGLTGDTGGKRVIMAHRDDLQVIYASDGELADIDYPKR